MLYAIYHPERIEAMFLQSPACFEDTTVPGYVDDMYNIRVQDQYDIVASRREVNLQQRIREEGIHPFEVLK